MRAPSSQGSADLTLTERWIVTHSLELLRVHDVSQTAAGGASISIWTWTVLIQDARYCEPPADGTSQIAILGYYAGVITGTPQKRHAPPEACAEHTPPSGHARAHVVATCAGASAPGVVRQLPVAKRSLDRRVERVPPDAQKIGRELGAGQQIGVESLHQRPDQCVLLAGDDRRDPAGDRRQRQALQPSPTVVPAADGRGCARSARCR